MIWRTGIAEGYPISGIEPHAAQECNNLYYRVLENGAWSGKAVPAHPLVTVEQQDTGSASWFVSTDPTGKVRVIWNCLPGLEHKEFLYNGRRVNSIGAGLVKEAVLDGTTAGPAREIHMAKVTDDPDYHTPACDDYDTIDGYVDAAGRAHFIALALHHGVGHPENNNRIHIAENGGESLALRLPGNDRDLWVCPPKLMVDAKGQRHIIAWYNAGEQPNIRDYVLGSEAEPSVIRAAKEVKGKILGFQAFQGPAGRMVVLMQMNDTGKETDDELYVSMSDGGKWSTPVSVTNNSSRLVFFSRNTSAASHVASKSYWFPGTSAATFDRQGHLVMVFVSNQFSFSGSVALGITVASSTSRTPNLLFLRF